MTTQPPLRIAALAADAMSKLDPADPKWEEKMRQTIARGHIAAWIAGSAERLGVRPDSPLLSRARLSRAERADITKLVDKQVTFLRAFAAARPDLSPAQIAARAQMYARAVAQTYLVGRWGDWDIPERLLPGNQTCRQNCKCEIEVEDHGDGTGTLTRTLHSEANCDECPPLAGEYEVRRK